MKRISPWIVGVGFAVLLVCMVTPTAAVAQPVQKTLFVANNVSDNISVFSVNPDGTLKVVPGSPFPCGENTQGIALSPDGRYLAATNAGAPSVEKLWLFEVGPTGALTQVPGNPWYTGDGPLDLDWSPRDYIYSPCAGDDNVRAYEVDSNALVELPGSPWGTPYFPNEADTSADGNYVYVSHLTARQITGFEVGPDGELTPHPAGPFPLPGDGFELKVTHDGQSLYVALGLGNAIAGYTVEANGKLTQLPGSPYASGATSAVNIAINPSGTFVFVAHVVSDGVTVMARDPDGTLAFVPGSYRHIGSDVRKIVAADDFVFVTDESSIDPGVGVMVYSYDAQGMMTLIPGSPFAAGSRPQDMELFLPFGLKGDLNCDGEIDFGDINPFVLALTDPAGYMAAYPHCDRTNADINEDGLIDFGDINPFVRLLTQPAAEDSRIPGF